MSDRWALLDEVDALDATDVGADPAGTAASAVSAHSADTTAVHGISDTATLVLNTRTVNGHALSADVTVTKSDVSLGNVDNTSDANKPVSTAQQTALNLKANLASPTFTGTVTIPTGASITAPTGLVKGDVGLGNVDNTSNATERAATATLTNKTLTNPVINTPTGIVKGDVGLGNVDNTSDATKNAAAVTLTNKTLTSPVLNTGVSGTAIDTDSTMAANSDTILASQKATKTALALKAPIAGPTFTGVVTSGGNVIANANMAVNATSIPTGTPAAGAALNVVQSSAHVLSDVTELTYIGTGMNLAATIDLRRVNATYANFVAASWSAVTSGQHLGGMHIGATTETLLLDCATFYCVADGTFADGSPVDSAHANTPTRWEFYTTPASSSGRTQTLALTIGSDQSLSVVTKLRTFTTSPATQTASYNMVDIAAATAFTNNAVALTTIGANLAPVITYTTAVGGANQAWRGFYDASTHQAGVAARLTGIYYPFHAQPTFKVTDNAAAQTVTVASLFRADATLVAGGATGTLTVTSLNGFVVAGFTVPTNATVATLTGLQIGGPVATGTITTRKGININDGSGAGTFTTNIGIDIAAFSAGGTNIGIRNASSLLQTGDVGFFGATAAGQQTSGANLTNNVTSGGTNDTITNWTNLSTYSTDAAAIRNAVYQLARKLKQINDGLRTLGIFT